MTITKRIELGTLPGSFPWAELRKFHDDINAREPAMQDRITCQIVGGKLFASVTRELTPAEEVQALRAQLDNLGERIRAVLPPNNAEPLSTSDRMALMKAIFSIVGEPGKPRTGSDIEGTQGPAAPPATPNVPTPPAPPPTDEQRRQQWQTITQMGGWKLPDQASEALKYARQMGMADLAAAEVERWESLAPGSLGV